MSGMPPPSPEVFIVGLIAIALATFYAQFKDDIDAILNKLRCMNEKTKKEV